MHYFPVPNFLFLSPIFLLFSKIFIPPEVWKEVTIKGRGLPGAHEVSQVPWFIFQKPDPLLVDPLSILVDAGEAEAIALAQIIPDCTILLDDSHARKIAKRLNLKHIGTVGLLLRSKKQGFLEEIKPSASSASGKWNIYT
jgi:hypothetical protein